MQSPDLVSCIASYASQLEQRGEGREDDAYFCFDLKSHVKDIDYGVGAKRERFLMIFYRSYLSVQEVGWIENPSVATTELVYDRLYERFILPSVVLPPNIIEIMIYTENPGTCIHAVTQKSWYQANNGIEDLSEMITDDELLLTKSGLEWVFTLMGIRPLLRSTNSPITSKCDGTRKIANSTYIYNFKFNL